MKVTTEIKKRKFRFLDKFYKMKFDDKNPIPRQIEKNK